MTFQCEYCNSIFYSLRSLYSHQRVNHRLQFNNDKCICQYCNVSFSTPSNKYTHEGKCHVRNTDSPFDLDIQGELIVDKDNEEAYPSTPTREYTNSRPDLNASTKTLFELISRMEGRSISSSAVNDIVSTFQILQNNILEHSETVEFTKINSKEKRDKLLLSQFIQHNPQKVTLNKCSFYRIPLQQAIEQLLNTPDSIRWLQTVLERQSTDGVIRDIIDGSVVRNCELLLKYPKSTALVLLFIDEVKLTQRNKYYMVYISLANFPSYHRSKLSSMKVLAAIPSEIVNNTGISIWSYILDDFTPFYENGIQCNLNNAKTLLHATLLCVLSDHKGAHELLGLSTAFNNMKRFCRFCLIHRDEMVTKDRTKFNKIDFNEYRQVASTIEYLKTRGVSHSLSSVYGIKGKTPFINVPGFKLTEQVPPCIMHTEFEGELKKEICDILIHCIDMKYFNIDQFNEELALQRGEIGLKSLVPPCITDKYLHGTDKCIMNALQLYGFAQLLPSILILLVHETTFFQSVKYQSLLAHLKYVNTAMKWEFSESDIELLDKQIDNHFDLYIKAYPDQFRPKTHYIFHYTENIRLLGPLVGISTTRYESKHQLPKKFMVNSNHKNDSAMILWKSFKHDVFNSDAMDAVTTKHETSLNSIEIQFLRDNLGFDFFQSARIGLVQCRNVVFTKGKFQFVLTSNGFCNIHDIFQVDGSLYFMLQLHLSQGVCTKSGYDIISTNPQETKFLMHISKIFAKVYVGHYLDDQQSLFVFNKTASIYS